MNWALLGGSLAGVLGLAGIAWLLGLGIFPKITLEGAIEEATERLPLFFATQAFVSTDARRAVVFGENGDVALIKVHGVQTVMRRLKQPLEWHRDGDAIVIHSGERMFGPIPLVLAPADRDKLLTLV